VKFGAVDVRPVRVGDLWLFEARASDPDATGTFNWSGFRDAGAIRRQFEQDGLLGPDGGQLVVTAALPAETGSAEAGSPETGSAGAEPAVVGAVSYRRRTYGSPDWWCWNIGITLLPEYRGRGLGAPAQARLVTYLFSVGAVERIEAWTDVRNRAEQRSLERVGFRREGVVRSAQFRSGGWRDVALYGLTRPDVRSAAGAGPDRGADGAGGVARVGDQARVGDVDGVQGPA
jgi:RimJ/RimL family protein N-acetyltransferase